MRLTLIAVAAVSIVATGTTLSTPSFSAAKKADPVPVTKSFNDCVALARQRGYSSSDLDSGGAGSNRARTFVIRCMQGRQK